MLGKVFGAIVLVAVFFGFWNGTGEQMASAALEGAGRAIELTLTLAGMMCLWCGVMRVLEEAGVIGKLARLLHRPLSFFFPDAAARGEGLEEICANPGISQDKLAQLICINKSNVARQIAVLEEDGFVTRTASATDKRIMELYPTQKTLDLLPQIQKILQCWESLLTQDLTEEECRIVAEALVKMKSRASAYMED